MPLSEGQTKRLEIAFSPSAPIQTENFFFGRLDHLGNVVEAIRERGQHIAVYGERGVGKTSFANITATRIHGVFPVKVTCNRNDGFRKMWDRAFQRVRFERNSAGMGFMPVERKEIVQLDLFPPDKADISSLDVQFVLEKISVPLLFVFDEFDTVEETSVVSEMADTIEPVPEVEDL